jgi:uncharacterized protein YjbI with pentapeptide repeats
MQQCQMTKAACAGARFAEADLTYADFSHADVSTASFAGATLLRAKFHRTCDRGAIFTSRIAALGDDEDLAEAERWRPVY